MKKIAVIGAGGINSWVVEHLASLRRIFFTKEMLFVKIYDNDEVEEKNILRESQNFTADDLMESKAEVLAKKHGFDFANKFITEENINELADYDDIILGVDNHKARKLIYEYCIKNRKYLIDLRAQGARMSYFVIEPKLLSEEEQNKLIEECNKKFFNNADIMERKGSCQLEIDIKNDHIENANKVIAFMGIFCIYLKCLRKEKLSTNEWEFVY